MDDSTWIFSLLFEYPPEVDEANVLSLISPFSYQPQIVNPALLLIYSTCFLIFFYKFLASTVLSSVLICIVDGNVPSSLFFKNNFDNFRLLKFLIYYCFHWSLKFQNKWLAKLFTILKNECTCARVKWEKSG